MKNKILKTIITGALIASMAMGLTACGNQGAKKEDGSLTKITFCLDWTPNTNHTGIYVAQSLGYYKEAGLEVEIVQPPENGAALCCATGQAQFAVDAQDTLAAMFDSESGSMVTAVAAILQHNTSGIMTFAEDNIKSPKDLEGKTYSTWESPIEMAMLKNVVEADGGDFSKVTLIPNTITDEPAALAANQTDAIWVFYGWGGINSVIENINCNYFSFKDITEEFDYYTPVIIANNDFLKNNEEAAKKFLEATKKGYEYAIENPKEAADMLIAGDTTGSLKGSEDLVYKSQEWISKEYKKDAASWGVIDKDRWNTFYSWLYKNGLTTNDLTGKGFSCDYLK